jgi:hypothetical protein
MSLWGCVPDERVGEELDLARSANPQAARSARAASSQASKAPPRQIAPGTQTDQPLETRYTDRFERQRLGAGYRATSSAWRIEDGQLCAQEARNRPLWLRRRLPDNVRIEFDAVSHSEAGDLKVEVFGDGRSFAKASSYTNASSYILIYGGWKNSLHVLARINEHGADRLVLSTSSSGPLRAQPVVPGETYHFKIERNDGRTVTWLVDDIEVHSFLDRAPLKGEGHEFFGFNNWSARVCFDNLSITPLKD